jgi:hypothetical protein
VVSAVEGSSRALGCLLRRQEQEQGQDQESSNPLSICVRNWISRRQGRSSRRETDRRRNHKEVGDGAAAVPCNYHGLRQRG